MIFSSSVSASELVSDVIASIDAAPIPDAKRIYGLLNNFLRQLYSDVIEDVRCVSKIADINSEIFINGIRIDGCMTPRVSDVVKVVSDGYEYECVGADFCEEHISDGCHYYKADGEAIRLLGGYKNAEEVKIYFRVLPEAYSQENSNEPLCLPCEFVGLAHARLRSDIYRMLGEDELCVSSTEEYNGILAHFAAWLEARR